MRFSLSCLTQSGSAVLFVVLGLLLFANTARVIGGNNSLQNFEKMRNNDVSQRLTIHLRLATKCKHSYEVQPVISVAMILTNYIILTKSYK